MGRTGLMGLLMLGWGLCAHGAISTAPNLGDNSVQVTDSTQYRWIRSQPLAGLSGGNSLSGQPPGFRISVSTDGHIFRSISTNEFAFVDATANAQCFTPPIMVWNNNFWVAYDVFATKSSGTPAFTNRLGLARSPDLLSWTNVGPILLPSVGVANVSPATNSTIWGGRWYMENNVPYFTWAISATPGAHAACYIANMTDSTGTNWSAPQIILPSGYYDPCMIKNGSTYYVWGVAVSGAIDLYTNNNITSMFTLKTANVFSGVPIIGSGMEGPDVVTVTNGSFWRMYTVGDPSQLGHMYWMESSDLATWTFPTEVVENQSVGDNGGVWPLAAKFEANAAQLVDRISTDPQEHDKYYFITTTNNGSAGTGNGQTNWCMSQNVIQHDYYVVGWATSGRSASAHYSALHTGDLITGNDLVTQQHLVDRQGFWDSSSGMTVLVNAAGVGAGGVFLQITNTGITGIGWKWFVREVIQTVCAPYYAPNVVTDPTVSADFLANPILASLKVTGAQTNTGNHILTSNGVTVVSVGINADMRLQSTIGASNNFGSLTLGASNAAPTAAQLGAANLGGRLWVSNNGSLFYTFYSNNAANTVRVVGTSP